MPTPHPIPPESLASPSPSPLTLAERGLTRFIHLPPRLVVELIEEPSSIQQGPDLRRLDIPVYPPRCNTCRYRIPDGGQMYCTRIFRPTPDTGFCYLRGERE